MVSKQKIYQFLNSQNHMVISSVNASGNPEAAMVGFAQNKNLEIIFGTDMTTRKAQNLSHNSQVALVINGEEHNVQYEGTAKQINGEELQKMQKIFFKKVPGLKKYAQLTNQIYFKITPTWIRFIDHTFSPGRVSEMRF
jgi:uncharacterized protein YhbP (UPF0306 family)